MKRALAWLAAIVVVSCGPGEEEPATLGSITPAELTAALDGKDFLLVNVHVPHEGEIPGTDSHISYLEIDALEAALDSDLERRAVLYCKSDHMSDIAGEALVELGYRRIEGLAGGMNGWVEAGYSLDP